MLGRALGSLNGSAFAFIDDYSIFSLIIPSLTILLILVGCVHFTGGSHGIQALLMLCLEDCNGPHREQRPPSSSSWGPSGSVSSLSPS